MCSVFTRYYCWFQRASRICSLTDWLCHLPHASPAVLHLFSNTLSTWRVSLWHLDCLICLTWPCCLLCFLPTWFHGCVLLLTALGPMCKASSAYFSELCWTFEGGSMVSVRVKFSTYTINTNFDKIFQIDMSKFGENVSYYFLHWNKS